MADYYNLGDHSLVISTNSPEAQLWFDRGFIWAYGFNHDEAIHCFEKALEHDPNCAMAHWGIAYAVGPNYNKPWEAFDELDLTQTLSHAYESSRRAQNLATNATEVERKLIEALQKRYQSDSPVTQEELTRWNDDYADAMREVYGEHEPDLDIAALFAEALLNRTPWQLWDLEAGGIAEGASTVEATNVLEKTLEDPSSRTHPGVLHMYIHLMEMSPHPERALRAGDWLRTLVPDAGHLVHMPTHIDVLCGHYDNVVKTNEQAIIADSRFLKREGPINFYSLYRSHNYHFKLYGAMFLGQLEAALDAANELERTIPEKLLRVESPPMADWLESFVPMRVHVLIRFGRWQELIDMPLPADQDLYCVTTALIHYGKGVACAATGRVAEAEKQSQLFEAAVTQVPESRYLFNNSALDILAIAREMLYGEIEYRKGNYVDAYAHLREAIDLDDGLPYDEPWGWMQPTRHAYGALLLEQGHVEQAEAIYRADLGLDDSLARPYQHPENIWSLHGYHECLMLLGKHDIARMVKQRLDLAAARADVPIHASCFCRMSGTSHTPAAM
jgi:tetratricopeptide (TPR) repeat protein